MELQLADNVSPGEYRGTVPEMTGPEGGRDTTCSREEEVAVWKRGASPDTSHLNSPLVARLAWCNRMRESVDLYS